MRLGSWPRRTAHCPTYGLTEAHTEWAKSVHPSDTALGRAGGFGFGGREGVVRPDTATLIAELTGVPPPDAAALNASVISASQPAGDTWDDDPDN